MDIEEDNNTELTEFVPKYTFDNYTQRNYYSNFKVIVPPDKLYSIKKHLIKNNQFPYMLCIEAPLSLEKIDNGLKVEMSLSKQDTYIYGLRYLIDSFIMNVRNEGIVKEDINDIIEIDTDNLTFASCKYNISIDIDKKTSETNRIMNYLVGADKVNCYVYDDVLNAMFSSLNFCCKMNRNEHISVMDKINLYLISVNIDQHTEYASNMCNSYQRTSMCAGEIRYDEIIKIN
jgi:hypothetical protein